MPRIATKASTRAVMTPPGWQIPIEPRSFFSVSETPDRLQTQTEKLDCVLAQNFFLVLLRNLRALGDRAGDLAGLGRIPMRRIGGEHEPVTAEIFHRPFEQAVFEGLAADINALVENVRRLALLPGNQVRQLFPVLVHARQPPGHL